jgi:DNA-binding NarL/FixJ family response regulator
MLPEKRGTDILKALRGNGKNLIPNTRVIVMTNFDQDTESRVAMQHDVDAYLIKAEITPRKLLDVISKLDSGSQPVEN